MNFSKFIIFLFAFIFSIQWVAYASENKQDKKESEKSPPAIGNFFLAGSQQPGSFISFGQNIVDKNTTQIVVFSDKFAGVDHYSIDLAPNLVYGLTDSFSINVVTPIAVRYKQDEHYSSGMEDSVIQLEYAFYQKSTSRFSDQATIVTNLSFPTGSRHKNPVLGFGSPSFFLGTTFIHTYTKWFAFTSHGVQFTTYNPDHIKYGNNFFYQFGLGRNIKNIYNKWILAGLVELDGQYTEKQKIHSSTDPNSGGNIIYLTPSLWLSSKNLILQLGAGYPVIQHLLGDQKKNSYLLAASITWTLS